MWLVVKTVPAGEKIGYGGTFETKRETVLATVTVGYGDGYPRSYHQRDMCLLMVRKLL